MAKARDIAEIAEEEEEEEEEEETLIRPPPFSEKKDRLVGLVVKACASRAEDPGFESHLRRDISGSSHTGDLNIGTPVATLPGAWCYRVNTGTVGPVSVYCNWVR